MSAFKLAGLQPGFRQMVDYALRVLDYYGIRYEVTSGFRSLADQKRLYDQRARNPYPVAAPGNSAHNFGLAVDVAGATDQDDAAITWVFTQLGFGTVREDKVHFEYPNWRRWVKR